MKLKHLVSLMLVVVLAFAGCEIIDANGNTPTPASIVTYTPVIVNIEVITPNVTQEVTSAPTKQADTATPVITAEPTSQAPTDNPQTAQNKQDMEAFLPPLDTRLDFNGIAETGHYGNLSQSYSDDSSALYEFNGTYNDGMGVPDEFTVQYFCNFERGTITEKALYNERLDKNEFHSKLHNIVVLKFPLSIDATWSHETTINGSKYWVYAEVIEYDGTSVKVLYTVPNVPDYYNETYFEMRTFEIGYAMTSFGNIMPGELDMSGVDTSDENAVKNHIMNMHMFGYSLYK